MRKPNHEMANVIMPIYILAAMGCFSFLVPANGGERISFIMTILLGMILSIMMIESRAPPSGDHPTPMIFNFIYYVYALRWAHLKNEMRNTACRPRKCGLFHR